MAIVVEDLVFQILQNNEHAFKQLYQMYYPTILR